MMTGMKKAYSKPATKTVCLYEINNLMKLASATEEAVGVKSALSRDEDNHFWDDDEEYTPSTPQTPW